MNKLKIAAVSSALLITAVAQQASAGVGATGPVSVDGPSSLSLLALGLTGAVLLARYFKR